MKPHYRNHKAALFVATLLVVACTDTTAPFDDVSLREQQQIEDVPATTISHSPDAPALETYNTSFVAVQGSSTRFAVNYVNGDRFIELEIREDAQLLLSNGFPAKVGDSVTITLEIHPTRFAVQFASGGTTLDTNQHATLTFFCKHAGNVGAGTLRIWRQYAGVQGWQAEPTALGVFGDRLDVAVGEFSNYAVAW